MTAISDAQRAGQIRFSDVTFFLFATPTETFINDLDPLFFPIPISTTDASMSAFGTFLSAHGITINPFVDIDFNDQNRSGFESQFWSTGFQGAPHGFGHWTISGASTPVPEPSNAVVALFGAVSGIAYVHVRKRRAQQRQGTGGQPRPCE
jgi:hypothetical protein